MRNRESGFRKAYLRQFVERIEVDDDEIRMRGSHAALAQGLAARPVEAEGGVPSFGADWWARQDSNLRQHRYERRVLTN
jgi:site-specific DNA recombinase